MIAVVAMARKQPYAKDKAEGKFRRHLTGHISPIDIFSIRLVDIVFEIFHLPKADGRRSAVQAQIKLPDCCIFRSGVGKKLSGVVAHEFYFMDILQIANWPYCTIKKCLQNKYLSADKGPVIVLADYAAGGVVLKPPYTHRFFRQFIITIGVLKYVA